MSRWGQSWSTTGKKLQYAAELSRLRFLRGRGKEKEGIGLLTTPSSVQTRGGSVWIMIPHMDAIKVGS